MYLPFNSFFRTLVVIDDSVVVPGCYVQCWLMTYPGGVIVMLADIMIHCRLMQQLIAMTLNAININWQSQLSRPAGTAALPRLIVNVRSLTKHSASPLPTSNALLHYLVKSVHGRLLSKCPFCDRPTSQMVTVEGFYARWLKRRGLTQGCDLALENSKLMKYLL